MVIKLLYFIVYDQLPDRHQNTIKLKYWTAITKSRIVKWSTFYRGELQRENYSDFLEKEIHKSGVTRVDKI